MKKILAKDARVLVALSLVFVTLLTACGLISPGNAFASEVVSVVSTSMEDNIHSDGASVEADIIAPKSSEIMSEISVLPETVESRIKEGDSLPEVAHEPSNETDRQAGTSSESIGPVDPASTTKDPVLTGYVFISGNTKVGDTLVAGVEGTPENAVLAFQWYRGESAITGATTNAYITTSVDDGCDISCRVTASGYEGVLVSGVIRPTLPAPPQAFAVYSANDHSLNFYKRPYVPNVGDVFMGKTTTAVYTGIESADYHGNAIPWAAYLRSILSVFVVDNGIQPVNTAYWFSGLDACLDLDLSKLDTSKVTNMTEMFFGCSSLKSLEVTNLDTSQVTDMSWMFFACDSLESLDLSTWDTSQVVNTSWMFASSHALTTVVMAGWDTFRITDMSAMFEDCSSLVAVDMSGWDTSNVMDMTQMFSHCTSLSVLDLSSFDISEGANVGSMFWNCSSLTTIYTASNAVWPEIPSTESIMQGDVRLVGGLGTPYDDESNDGLHTRVDGLGGKPGYFTPKIAVSYFDPETETTTTPALYVYGLRAAESALEGFLGWALTPNASQVVFRAGELLKYDPANIKDLVLYPVQMPALTGVAVISGDPNVGGVLSAVVNGVQADAQLQCQWYRGDTPISGAIGATYVLVREDRGSVITCKIGASNYRGTLVSNAIGSIAYLITVEYWSTTDTSPEYMVIVHTEVADLGDLFNYRFDQNKDADPSNDYVGYKCAAWTDECCLGFYEITAPYDEFTTTLEDIANMVEWDGASPLRMYSYMDIRYIEVTYYAGVYEEKYQFDKVRSVLWDCPPYLSGLVVAGYKMISQTNEYGDELDESMTCGYILTELLDDPWADTLDIYIDWISIEYRVNYVYPNGISSSAGMMYEGEIYLPSEGLGFVYPGHEFIGWFTEPDGTGMQVLPGMKYCNIEENDKITERNLYACFRQLDLAGSVAIAGETYVGKTLSAVVSGAPSDAQLRYQWYRGEVPIEGATSSTYVLVRADGQNSLTCKVSDANYAGTLVSNEVGPVVHLVTVEYWSYTDASPEEMVIVHSEVANVTDIFNHRFDQNDDDDPSNDLVGYQHCGWYDEWTFEYCDSAIPEDGFTMTIERIADHSYQLGKARLYREVCLSKWHPDLSGC